MLQNCIVKYWLKEIYVWPPKRLIVNLTHKFLRCDIIGYLLDNNIYFIVCLNKIIIELFLLTWL